MTLEESFAQKCKRMQTNFDKVFGRTLAKRFAATIDM